MTRLLLLKPKPPSIRVGDNGAVHFVAINSVHVRAVGEISAALAVLVQEPNSGIIVMPDPFIMPNRELIRTLAARHRIPAILGFPYMALEGGLVAHGVDNLDMFQRSADYADRILRGAQPAELPIQAPVRFGLAVNLKTAKAMGIDLSQTLLARADEVVE